MGNIHHKVEAVVSVGQDVILSDFQENSTDHEKEDNLAVITRKQLE